MEGVEERVINSAPHVLVIVFGLDVFDVLASSIARDGQEEVKPKEKAKWEKDDSSYH